MIYNCPLICFLGVLGILEHGGNRRDEGHFVEITPR